MTVVQERSRTVWGREIEPDFAVRLARPSPQSPGANVKITGLDKAFHGVPVLRGLDLEVPAGQFVAVVGKSGCGKSTLIRLLSGLDAPDAGRIELTSGTGNDPANARIVFQEPRLLPWASVRDNVAVGLGPGNSATTARDAADGALEAVQLSDKASEWPSSLSGGQKQRVALARALVSRPDFLALDEPLGALDALTRITMQGLVESVWSEQRFTALFVTHDVGEAVALADRVIVLDHGRIALDLEIELLRPRERASAQAAVYQQKLLDAILH